MRCQARRHRGFGSRNLHAAPATLSLFNNWLSTFLSFIGRTGLCSSKYPLSCASRSRSGAVSPLIRKAGTAAPNDARNFWIA